MVCQTGEVLSAPVCFSSLSLSQAMFNKIQDVNSNQVLY